MHDCHARKAGLLPLPILPMTTCIARNNKHIALNACVGRALIQVHAAENSSHPTCKPVKAVCVSCTVNIQYLCMCAGQPPSSAPPTAEGGTEQSAVRQEGQVQAGACGGGWGHEGGSQRWRPAGAGQLGLQASLSIPIAVAANAAGGIRLLVCCMLYLHLDLLTRKVSTTLCT